MWIPDKEYKVSTVANKLRVKQETVRQWIRQGKLRASKQGKYWVITGKQVLDFLKPNY